MYKNVACEHVIVACASNACNDNTSAVDVKELRREVGRNGCQHITRIANVWEEFAVLCKDLICCSNCRFRVVLEDVTLQTIQLGNLWPSAHRHSHAHTHNAMPQFVRLASAMPQFLRLASPQCDACMQTHAHACSCVQDCLVKRP